MLRTANESHFNGAVWFTRRGDSAAKLIVAVGILCREQKRTICAMILLIHHQRHPTGFQ
jgi:hypothetical protein